MEQRTVLGKNVLYSDIKYSPDVLVRLLRKSNREKYNIHDNNLPFNGYDEWHCYEISTLQYNGIPINFIGKIKYSSTSEYIVLSKSLKLYLNGFNMTKTYIDSIDWSTKQALTTIILNDLTNLLHTNVLVNLYTIDEFYIDLKYIDLPKLLHICLFSEILIDKYELSPEVLETYRGDTSLVKVSSDIIRSNCKITHQPDWGSVVIKYIPNSLTHIHVTNQSLLQYLISFRKENHFHELVCLMIYKRLWDLLSPDALYVACYYTRRGGIDINPVRYHGYDINQLNNKFIKLERQ